MVRKTKEEALETRERILNASIDVFHEQGVANSSLEEIALAAGVTRGAIYWHFKNKADIFSALHDRLHVPIMRDLLTVQQSLGPNPLKELIDFCVFYLNDLWRDKQKRKIYGLFIMKCDYSGEMAPLLEEQNLKKSESLLITTKFFESAIQKKIISSDSDAKLLALSFYCYMCGICTEFLRNPELFNLEKQALPLIERFFKNL